LTPIHAGFRGGILTGQFFITRRGVPGARPQHPVTPRVFGAASATRDLARLLRKHSSDEARPNGSKPKRTEGAAMIAATAFAVVGLVVIAFLNRIP
jgi:hypothetical protein